MAHVCSKFSVGDFAEWKEEFSSPEGVELRKRGGMKSYQMFRVGDESNTVVLICEFADQETARQFIESAELRAKHHESGGTEAPQAVFLDQIEVVQL